MSNSLTLLLNIRSQRDPEALLKDLAVATRDSMRCFVFTQHDLGACELPRRTLSK